MNIFKNKSIKNAMSYSNFIDFIKDIESEIKINFSTILELPWDNYQKSLATIITKSLYTFKQEALDCNIKIPATGLKGIYFCLGDDAKSLCIAGSLYFNEIDWAANADLYASDDAMATDLISNIVDSLDSLELHKSSIPDLIYLFSAFTINKAITTLDNIPEIANAGVVLGYSDGDELILGHFVKSKFIQKIKIVKDGKYKSLSSIKNVHIERPTTGPIYNYLRWNYRDFIKENNLQEWLEKGGELEAKRISTKFKKYIFINRCPKCDFIKMTPLARLCLSCGDFSEIQSDTLFRKIKRYIIRLISKFYKKDS